MSELDAVEKTEVVKTFVSMLIIVPAAILDAFFYYWILLSLIRTKDVLMDLVNLPELA